MAHENKITLVGILQVGLLQSKWLVHGQNKLWYGLYIEVVPRRLTLNLFILRNKWN